MKFRVDLYFNLVIVFEKLMQIYIFKVKCRTSDFNLQHIYVGNINGFSFFILQFSSKTIRIHITFLLHIFLLINSPVYHRNINTSIIFTVLLTCIGCQAGWQYCAAEARPSADENRTSEEQVFGRELLLFDKLFTSLGWHKLQNYADMVKVDIEYW